MKILLLVTAIIISNHAFAFNTEQSSIKKEVVYDGTYLSYVDLAFDRYLEEKSQTKYNFLLLKENYVFSLTEKNDSVVINFDFKRKEFKKSTGETVFGGGAIVVLEKKTLSITSFKMHR